MDYIDRYEKNHAAISEAEQEILAGKSVIVVGCGGLGGYIIELLTRLGVGRITAVDGDSFAPSNLNRQLLATGETLGREKAVCAGERAAVVNPTVELIPVTERFTEENADRLLEGQDLVIDALDNCAGRLLLAKKAAEHGISMVSGAIIGWYGRVLVVRPGDNTPELLWSGGEVRNPLGNLGFTAACTAAMECAEACKILLGRPDTRNGAILEFSLLTGEFYTIPLK